MTLTNEEIYRQSVAATLGLTAEDIGEIDILAMLRRASTAPPQVSTWRLILVALHVRYCMLSVFTPSGRDAWTQDTIEEDEAIKDAFRSAIGSLNNQPSQESTRELPSFPYYLIRVEYLPSEQGDPELEAVLNRARISDRDLALANGMLSDLASSASFSQGDALSGLRHASTILEGTNTLWRLLYVDHLIDRISLKRSDLRLTEWLWLVTLTNQALDKTPHGSLLELPKWGAPTTALFKEYWAWRFGFVASLGSHLWDEFVDRIRSEAEMKDFGGRRALPPVAAASLLMTHEAPKGWENLRSSLEKLLVRAWDSDQDPGSDLVETLTEWADSAEPWPLVYLHGPGSGIHWLTRIGYVDGITRRLERVRPSEMVTADDAHSALGTTALALADTVRKAESQREEIIEAALRNLLPSLWPSLPSDVRRELMKAERFYEDGSQMEWEYRASQGYANTAETLLRLWMRPLVKQYIGGERLPRFLGEWDWWLRSAHRLRVRQWPVLQESIVVELADKVQILSEVGRPLAHPGQPPIAVSECRETLLGLTGSGLIELTAKVARKWP